jgi:hypothetical protein
MGKMRRAHFCPFVSHSAWFAAIRMLVDNVNNFAGPRLHDDDSIAGHKVLVGLHIGDVYVNILRNRFDIDRLRDAFAEPDFKISIAIALIVAIRFPSGPRAFAPAIVQSAPWCQS